MDVKLVKITNIIRERLAIAKEEISDHDRTVRLWELSDLVYALAVEFGDKNPEFSQQSFIEACGFGV